MGPLSNERASGSGPRRNTVCMMCVCAWRVGCSCIGARSALGCAGQRAEDSWRERGHVLSCHLVQHLNAVLFQAERCFSEWV